MSQEIYVLEIFKKFKGQFKSHFKDEFNSQREGVQNFKDYFSKYGLNETAIEKYNKNDEFIWRFKNDDSLIVLRKEMK
jgi:hypothetical protein